MNSHLQVPHAMVIALALAAAGCREAATSAKPALVVQDSQATREALAREVDLGGRRLTLRELAGRLHQAQGFSWAGETGCLYRRAGPFARTSTVRKVLSEAARELDMDLEVREAGGGVVVTFWDRPDPATARALEKLAASDSEAHRWIAARWLPKLGNKPGLVLAAKLLADPSRKVGYCAARSLVQSWRMSYGDRARPNPLAFMAPRGTGRVIASAIQDSIDRKSGEGLSEWIDLAWDLGDPAAVEPLKKIAWLQAVEGRRVWRGGISYLNGAYRALGEIGGPEAEAALVELYEKALPQNKVYVLQEMGRLRTPKARQVLLNVLNSSADRGLRLQAARVLRWPGNVEAVRPLMDYVEKEKLPSDRACAIRSLLLIGAPKGVEAGRKAMADLPKYDCLSLCSWLARVSPPASGEWLLPFAEKHATRNHANVLNLLAEIGSEKSVPTFIRVLKSRDKELCGGWYSLAAAGILHPPGPVRIAPKGVALHALAAMENQRAVQAVLDCAKSDDRMLRAAAIHALGLHGQVRAAGALREALKDSDALVRAEAAWSLGALGRPADAEALLAASKRAQPDKHNSAGEALIQYAALAGKSAGEELVKAAGAGRPDAVHALLVSRDPELRRTARELLAADGAKLLRPVLKWQYLWHYSSQWYDQPTAMYALPGIIGLLTDSEPAVRTAAVRLIAASSGYGILDRRAVAPLCKLLLEDTSTEVRRAVIEIMGAAGDDPAVVAALRKASCDDKDEYVRQNAGSVLKRIGLGGKRAKQE